MQGDYIASTMAFGIAKLIPIILFAFAGYFIFIKLPFWIFLRVLRASKGLPPFEMAQFKTEEPQYKPDYNVHNYEAFLRKQKRSQDAEERASRSSENVLQFETFQREEKPQKPESEQEKKERAEMNERRKKYAEELRAKAQEQNRKREEAKRQREQEKKEQEQRERYARQEREQEERQKRYQSGRDRSGLISPESIFNLQPGQNFTKDELKRRYRDLLKVNHPDKINSPDPEAKAQAEKKTKQINSAYDQLKYRAS